jgi:hypothetical protein
LEALEGRIAPSIFSVTNTNDSGAGSLRQSILDANALSGADTIQFDPTVFATSRAITLVTGELLVTDDLTITGPGASLLTVSGNNASRVIEINAAGRVLNVTLTGATVSGGVIPSGRGGGLYTADENVTLANMVITGNFAGGSSFGPFCTGGGIAAGANGNLVLRNTTVLNNACVGYGGGISCFDFGAGGLFLESSTVSGNSCNFGGGGIYLSRDTPSGNFTVNNSTISGNTSTGGLGVLSHGGGISTVGPIGPGGFIVRNSTISGNTAYYGGGISVYAPVGIATIQNATITKNNANSAAGGIFKRGTAPMSLTSCIVSGNTVGTVASDIGSVGALISASYSTFGVDPGPGVLSSPSIGNLAFGANLNLGPLADNGGPTQTHALGAGSLAIDHGSNPSGGAFDQRGQARLSGAAADIGAFESATSAPAASTTVGDVTTSGGTSYVFTVTYIAAAGINIGTLDSSDLRVTGPGGFNVLATFAGVDTNTNGSPRAATYRITPPGGSWDFTDDGSYTISMEPAQVTDANAVPVASGPVGSFRAIVPRIRVVTNANDSGAGSLREALTLQSSSAPLNITFDPTFFAIPRTIQAQSLLPAIQTPITIAGPGTALLTIAGAGLSVLNVVSFPYNVSLSGMTLTRAYGVYIFAGYFVSVTMDGLVISNGGKGDSGGGGIQILGTPTVTVRNSTISGNVAGDLPTTRPVGGGGIYTKGGTLIVENCTISGNSTSTVGGGICLYIADALNVTVRNTTISGNTAGTSGGGIMFGNPPPQIPAPVRFLVQNCTIANNRTNGAASGQGGGGIGSLVAAGITSIESTIVANNTNANAPDALGSIAASFSLIRNQTGATVSGSNNLPAGTDPRLGPLQNNGGTTQTIALLPGSPAINAGSNPASLTTDQRGAGYTRVFESAADIGAFEAQQTTVPSVVVNAGQANLVQRSMVTSLTVTFSGVVTFTGQAAFQLARTGPGTTGNVTLAVDLTGSTATQTIAHLTFSGPLTEGANSLIDGNYALTILSNQVNGGLLGGDSVSSLFRLFGDVNGDKTVNITDLTAFRNAFGATTSDPNYQPFLDFNSDGVINLTDLTQFRNRFGVILP